jgi:hypothetical protein
VVAYTLAMGWLQSICANAAHIAHDEATNALGVLDGSLIFDQEKAIKWLRAVSRNPFTPAESREYAAVLAQRITDNAAEVEENA